MSAALLGAGLPASGAAEAMDGPALGEASGEAALLLDGLPAVPCEGAAGDAVSSEDAGFLPGVVKGLASGLAAKGLGGLSAMGAAAT